MEILKRILKFIGNFRGLMQSKICGVKDSETLNFLINYKYPPELIGFICNYPKSKRFVDINFSSETSQS